VSSIFVLIANFSLFCSVTEISKQLSVSADASASLRTLLFPPSGGLLELSLEMHLT